MAKTQVVAVIAGDGIGAEVTREALKVLRAASELHSLPLSVEELDYGAERFLRDGVTLPTGEVARLRREAAAIFVGALGDARIPNMRHAREILLALRFELDLYINLRPVRCLHDNFCPLKNRSARDIDFMVVRENTEGAYAGVGGNFKKGSVDEVAINEDINTRKGVERIVRAAFLYAQDSGKRLVTMADKSNALQFAHDLWTRTFADVALEFPQVMAEHFYADALALAILQAPQRFQVIVTNNLFGDILSDVAAFLQGGLGMAASANINPAGPSLFEPVHGSAPPLAGKNIANPLAACLSMQMMLQHLGHTAAARSVSNAIGDTVRLGVLTRDVGGVASTQEVGDCIASRIGGAVLGHAPAPSAETLR